MKTALIVDDDPLILKMRSDRLTQEGFNVIQAENGEKGLAEAFEKHPDIIVLDIVMPVMDGLTMLGKLREDAWGHEVPVMILSSMQDSKNISDALNYKVFRYVIKDQNDSEIMVQAIHTTLKDSE